MDTLKQQLEQSGFEHIGFLDVRNLVVYDEVRAMCAADKCAQYDTSWSCPPACGSLEEYRALIAQYQGCYVFQTVEDMKTDFDYSSIETAALKHKERFSVLTQLVDKAQLDVRLFSAGTCTLCETCTYPDNPCVHPDLMIPSMEACGLLVSEICKQAGVDYYHGPRTIAFVSCALCR